MPEKEGQDKSLSELVVKEAVGVGMDSPMRDSILEAVEEAEGSSRKTGTLPLAGVLFGLGTAIGYLVGREAPSLEEASLEDVEEPEIIEDVIEETEAESLVETEEEEAETASRRLPRVLLALGALAGAAFLRRRLAGDEEAEWEPIEEFEPATSDGEDEEEEAEEEGEEVSAEGDEEEEE